MLLLLEQRPLRQTSNTCFAILTKLSSIKRFTYTIYIEKIENAALRHMIYDYNIETWSLLFSG